MPTQLQPHLDSQSIYSFDLDKRQLTFYDYDLFAPARDLVMHIGFVVKRIADRVANVKRCELRKARASKNSLTEAFKRSTKLPPSEARVDVVEGAVNFKIPDRLSIGAHEALLLALEYTRSLQTEWAI